MYPPIMCSKPAGALLCS